MTAHLCGACCGGWCAGDPLGSGQSGFQFIAGTSATDVWATGLRSLVFEWDGTAWHDRSSAWTRTGSPPASGPTRLEHRTV